MSTVSCECGALHWATYCGGCVERSDRELAAFRAFIQKVADHDASRPDHFGGLREEAERVLKAAGVIS